jgi:hypothetical protein
LHGTHSEAAPAAKSDLPQPKTISPSEVALEDSPAIYFELSREQRSHALIAITRRVFGPLFILNLPISPYAFREPSDPADAAILHNLAVVLGGANCVIGLTLISGWQQMRLPIILLCLLGIPVYSIVLIGAIVQSSNNVPADDHFNILIGLSSLVYILIYLIGALALWRAASLAREKPHWRVLAPKNETPPANS